MYTLFRWINVGLVALTALAYTAPLISPVTFWPLALFGVLAPWLLLANVLAVAFWIYVRRRFFLFSLLCLLVGWPVLSRLVAWSSAEAPDQPTLRVVSFNVHNFMPVEGGSQRYAPAEVISRLDDLQADVLLLQEFPRGETGRPYSRALRNQTPLKYIHQPEDGSLVIFSRYPLADGPGRFFGGQVNGFISAVMLHPQDTLRLVNAHLQSNAITNMADRIARERDLPEGQAWMTIKGMFSRYGRSAAIRTPQVAEILSVVNQSTEPVILGGDFNDVPSSYVYRMIDDSALTDTFLGSGKGLGVTFSGSLPGLRIDYVWASPALAPLDFQLYETAFSDHRILLSELGF